MKKAIIISILFFTLGCNSNKQPTETYREAYLKMGFSSGYLKGYLDAQRTSIKLFSGEKVVTDIDSINTNANLAAEEFLKFMNKHKD